MRRTLIACYQENMIGLANPVNCGQAVDITAASVVDLSKHW